MFFARFFLLRQKVIVVGSASSFFTIFDDEKAEDVLKEFYKRRNAYLRDSLLSKDSQPTKETLEWLLSRGVIGAEEFESHSKKKDFLGFNSESKEVNS